MISPGWFILLAQNYVSPEQLGPLPRGDLKSANVQNGLRLIFGITGSVAVLIIALAGFQYVAAQGEPQATAKAKNTIIDALIGLIIVILAFGIIEFVSRKVL